MVRHIVMFKLKAFATPAEKQAKMEEIKTRLEALKDKIDVLRSIRVDFNINPEETLRQPSGTCCRGKRNHRAGQGRSGVCGLCILIR